MRLWVNLYRQGWYHRAGKPGTMNIHPGDMYATFDKAIADIDPDAPYVGTVPVDVLDGVWAEDAPAFAEYPADSVPRPIRETRREPSHVTGMRPLLAEPMAQAVKQWENGVDFDPSTPGNLPVSHRMSAGQPVINDDLWTGPLESGDESAIDAWRQQVARL